MNRLESSKWTFGACSPATMPKHMFPWREDGFEYCRSRSVVVPCDLAFWGQEWEYRKGRRGLLCVVLRDCLYHAVLLYGVCNGGLAMRPNSPSTSGTIQKVISQPKGGEVTWSTIQNLASDERRNALVAARSGNERGGLPTIGWWSVRRLSLRLELPSRRFHTRWASVVWPSHLLIRRKFGPSFGCRWLVLLD